MIIGVKYFFKFFSDLGHDHYQTVSHYWIYSAKIKLKTTCILFRHFYVKKNYWTINYNSNPWLINAHSLKFLLEDTFI